MKFEFRSIYDRINSHQIYFDFIFIYQKLG